MERDIPAEAKSWRARLLRQQPDSKLAEAISKPLYHSQLTAAYLGWWEEYSRLIRESPSSRRVKGVREEDARAAGDAADSFTVALLQR